MAKGIHRDHRPCHDFDRRLSPCAALTARAPCHTVGCAHSERTLHSPEAVTALTRSDWRTHRRRQPDLPPPVAGRRCDWDVDLQQPLAGPVVGSGDLTESDRQTHPKHYLPRNVSDWQTHLHDSPHLLRANARLTRSGRGTHCNGSVFQP